MATTKQLVKKQRQLLKEFQEHISDRQKHSLSKSEEWQDSGNGAKYNEETEMLEQFEQELTAQLNEAGFDNL